MAHWIGILIGLGFAFYGFRRGFYDMWVILFNIAISLYLGIFLWPTITEYFPLLEKTSLHIAMTVLITSTIVFTILQSLASLLLIGQFAVILPKILDSLGAAILGFLTGMLLWSFVSLVITLTPVYEKDFVKELGFTGYSEASKATHLLWWGDFVNTFTGSSGNVHSTEDVINELLKKVRLKREEEKAKKTRTLPGKTESPTDKKGILQEAEKQKPLGPPPEPNYDSL